MGRTMEPGSPDAAAEGGQKHTERLIISHMVLENFKSYAGVQRVGPFHKCFSSVVGPNGSGKSNVIDAMLFVFGKRAKQLRLNKVSELIHNSTNHQNLDFARVSVHFQKIVDLEGEEYEVVPDTQFVVTRTAYRNNSSKYFVDDVPSTFTEVTKLLKAEGIDLDNNRFLILQGEVEQIAMMKPKGQAPGDEGLLEYLEDIIGTNKYVEAIEKSAASLEELNEKRGGLVQRVKMAEKDRDSLEEEKREAEKYMLKEAEVAKWSKVSCAVGLRDAARYKKELEQRVEQLQKNMEAELGKSQSAREELEKLKQEVDEYGKEYEVAREEMEKAQAEFQEFERKDVRYREELKNCKAKLKKLDDKIAKDTAKLQETVQATKDAEESLPGLEKGLEKSIKQLGKEEEVLESLQEKIRGQVASLQTKYEALRRQLEPFEEQLAALESKAEVTKTQHTLLTEKHATAKAQYEAAESGIKDKGAASEEKKAAVQQMKADEARARKELATAQAQEQAAGAEVAQKGASLEQLRGRLAELRDAVSSERNQSAVMNALQQALESGHIPGIYGRLGDLAGIDAKYDVAISTACGALDYVVVDTTNTAQQCVELLRRKQLGIATFLVLDKQQHLVQEMNQKLQTPEGVPRLFDLIRVSDDALRPAFFYALRNTVVAKDVDQGSRIAYGQDKRFKRVVTLGGDLFEASGTMSGGGGKPKGGKMGTAARPMGAGAAGRGGSGGQDTVRRLEAEAAETQADMQAAYERQQDARKRWSAAQEQVDRLRAEIPKTDLEAEGLKEQVKELQKRVAQLKASAMPSQAELKQLAALEKQVQAEEAEADKCRQSFAPLKSQVDDLQREIDETGKAELEAQREKVAATQKAISDTKASINRCRVQMSSSDKTVARLEKSIREAGEEKEKESAAVEQKKNELRAVEKEAFTVHEHYLAANERSSEKREVHEEARKKFAKLKQQVDKMRAGEVDTQLKLDDTKKQLKAYADSEKALEAKLKSLEAKLEAMLEQLKSDGLDEELQLEAMGPEPDMETLRKDDAQRKEAELVTQLKALKPNLAALEEYRKKQTLYDERVVELERVSREREESRKAYEELREQRLHEFMTGFNVISTRLKEMYQMITLGGDAELELVDSLDPFSEGIVFSVRPPKKSWKNICNLSGGEKTLSSLALVFALHHYKPTPLYVMDEIDAALDFKNVSIVAHYIKDRTKNAQFVIISLRNNMFELADHLVGIYKTHNCTKSLTIEPSAFTVSSTARTHGKDGVTASQTTGSQVTQVTQV